ncbi:hypothetical protein QCA50_014945 [Cerrena zonata]|uniref:Transcription regulator Rua1 C-terminal domain-containing protein n=1 Tax=Cerrena zonata TaxID=2478898 RepID=A0AAW0FPC5_9APHY
MQPPAALDDDVYDIQRQLTFISPPARPFADTAAHDGNDWGAYTRFPTSSLHTLSPFDHSSKQRLQRSDTSMVAADALLILACTSPQSSFFPSPASQAHTHTPHSTLFSKSPSDPLKMTEQFSGTPIHHLFSSSPAYWGINSSSVSPVIRTSSSPNHASQSTTSSVAHYRSRRRPSFVHMNSPAYNDMSPLTNISSTTSTPSASTDMGPPRGRRNLRGNCREVIDSNPTNLDISPLATDSPSPRRSTRTTRATARLVSGSATAPPRVSSSSSTRERPTVATPSNKRKASASRGRNVKRTRIEATVAASARPSSSVSDHEQDEETEDEESDSEMARPMRTFPETVHSHSDFPLLYRRFHVPSFQQGDHRKPGLSGSTWNEPKTPFDLYTPRFVKGRGVTKVGLCPICCESPKRGGSSKKLWLSMKYSAFNYHMQYCHGISPSSKAPFSPPIAYKLTDQPTALKNQKPKILKGKCHKCQKWLPVEGPKEVETKVKEIFWWKHAASCHDGSTINGERDVFVEDEFYLAAADDSNA